MKPNTRLLLFLLVLISNNSTAQFDLSKPFKECGQTGSFTLYDLKNKKWISSDIKDSQKPSLPASTFKIINTLIALESGVISDPDQLIKWPGCTDTVKYGYRPDIYHDISMKEAFRLSAGWAYIEMAKKIGRENYRRYLTKSKYGNVDLSQADDDFWNF